MALTLWVSTSGGTDLDLFAKLRKFDAAGREICYNGYNGFAIDGVAKAGRHSLRSGATCGSHLLIPLVGE